MGGGGSSHRLHQPLVLSKTPFPWNSRRSGGKEEKRPEGLAGAGEASRAARAAGRGGEEPTTMVVPLNGTGQGGTEYISTDQITASKGDIRIRRE